MAIDFEVKAFAIVSIFALLKVFGASPENSFWLQFARLFFTGIHIFITIIFIKTILKVDNTVGTVERKNLIRSKLRQSFGNILLRGLIILLIHWKTQMLQPLFVSSTLGLFTLLELDDVMNEKKNN